MRRRRDVSRARVSRVSVATAGRCSLTARSPKKASGSRCAWACGRGRSPERCRRLCSFRRVARPPMLASRNPGSGVASAAAASSATLGLAATRGAPLPAVACLLLCGCRVERGDSAVVACDAICVPRSVCDTVCCDACLSKTHRADRQRVRGNTGADKALRQPPFAHGVLRLRDARHTPHTAWLYRPTSATVAQKQPRTEHKGLTATTRGTEQRSKSVGFFWGGGLIKLRGRGRARQQQRHEPGP